MGRRSSGGAGSQVGVRRQWASSRAWGVKAVAPCTRWQSPLQAASCRSPAGHRRARLCSGSCRSAAVFKHGDAQAGKSAAPRDDRESSSVWRPPQTYRRTALDTARSLAAPASRPPDLHRCAKGVDGKAPRRRRCSVARLARAPPMSTHFVFGTSMAVSRSEEGFVNRSARRTWSGPTRNVRSSSEGTVSASRSMPGSFSRRQSIALSKTVCARSAPQ